MIKSVGNFVQCISVKRSLLPLLLGFLILLNGTVFQSQPAQALDSWANLTQQEKLRVLEIMMAGAASGQGNLRYRGVDLSCKRTRIFVSRNVPNVGMTLLPIRWVFLNKKFLRQFPVYFTQYVMAHECAHAQGIVSETKADTYAIKQGVKEGWMTARRLNDICARFMIHTTPGQAHPAGATRCKRMMNDLKQAEKRHGVTDTRTAKIERKPNTPTSDMRTMIQDDDWK